MDAVLVFRGCIVRSWLGIFADKGCESAPLRGVASLQVSGFAGGFACEAGRIGWRLAMNLLCGNDGNCMQWEVDYLCLFINEL
jgi:hypothetical protein